jgi:hypothetical protein
MKPTNVIYLVNHGHLFTAEGFSHAQEAQHDVVDVQVIEVLLDVALIRGPDRSEKHAVLGNREGLLDVQRIDAFDGRRFRVLDKNFFA